MRQASSIEQAPIWRLLLVLLLILPWINPFASGPSPAVLPWLLSAACATLLWMLPGRLDAELVASALLAAALLSAAIAILQYFGLAGMFSPWINQPEAGQAFGNLRQRNQFASLMSLGLVALIFLGPAPALRWHVGWMLALLAIGLASSLSRTGLAQWLFVALLILAWGRRAPRQAATLVSAALGLYLAAVLLLPAALQRLSAVESGGLLARLGSETVDCNSRITLWSNVLYLVAQRPWTGWGWGELDYAHYITLYPGERFCDILDNAHNLPLHLAVELGLPVALLFLVGLCWLVVRARPWAEQAPGRQMAWTWLALLGLHSLLEYPLWYGPFQITALWCVWYLLVAGNAAQAANHGVVVGVTRWGQVRFSQPMRLSCGSVALALCAYAFWDYWRVSQIYLVPERRAASYRTETLSKISSSVLFRSQVEFAELATTPMSRANSERLFQISGSLLHFSPEVRVIETLIESATLLGRRDVALFHLARYRQAFAAEHGLWSGALARRAKERADAAASASN